MNPTLIGFIKKELIQAVRDPRMKFILFVMPVVQLTLFGFAISNEVKNMRLAAVYEPRDTVMRDIYDRAIGSGWFVPADAGGGDPYALIRADKADAVLVAPPGGFSKALGRGEAPLQLLVDATNSVQAQAVESYLKAIVAQAVASALHAGQPPPPIRFDVRILFNPSLVSAVFMVPGVMTMVLLVTTMLLANIAITREKEIGTFEMLISAPVSRSEVIFGKTLPYILVGLSNLPLVLGVAVFVFHVPMRGSFLALAASAFVFVCTTVAMGTLISTFCNNQQQASMAGFLTMFPMMMFSGLFFPIQNIPWQIRWMAWLDPLAHFLGLLRNILLKGGDPRFIALHVGVLAVLAAVSVAVSFRRFHTTLS